MPEIRALMACSPCQAISSIPGMQFLRIVGLCSASQTTWGATVNLWVPLSSMSAMYPFLSSCPPALSAPKATERWQICPLDSLEADCPRHYTGRRSRSPAPQLTCSRLATGSDGRCHTAVHDDGLTSHRGHRV